MSIRNKLSDIQKKLKVEKGQMNKFGGYAYRSSEDILEAVKPLLGDLTLTIDEKMEVLSSHDGGTRFYKVTTATLSDDEGSISATAWTREDESQKGMSSAQLSGSVGSYGKKYALGNLFALDDTKDDDATNTHGKDAAPKKPSASKESKQEKKAGSGFRKRKQASGSEDDI